MCQGITHGWPSSRSTLSWGLQVHRCLLRRIHGCVIPGRSSTKGSVGPSGTCFSYAGVPSSSEGGAYAEESCSDGLARHPAGTAKTLGRRWWCTLNCHLVRSRFSETVSIPPPVSVKYAWLYGKLVLNELRISKKYAYASPPSFLIPEQLNLDKYRFGMLQVFLFKTSSLWWVN